MFLLALLPSLAGASERLLHCDCELPAPGLRHAPNHAEYIMELGGEVTRGDQEAPPAPRVLPQRRLNLDFDRMSVDVALRYFAETGDINIMTADGVAGSVTISVESVTWEEALGATLLAAGLHGHWMGDNIIVVTPASAASR